MLRHGAIAASSLKDAWKRRRRDDCTSLTATDEDAGAMLLNLIEKMHQSAAQLGLQLLRSLLWSLTFRFHPVALDFELI